ncbi:MAG: hypothetical protein EOP36_16480 [Rubrivivax sp.]|nr:MAG: hypothetical protein EOP36_16480 [Rubrivivax sp.]
MIKPLIQGVGRPEAAEEIKKAMASMSMSRSTRYQVHLDSSWPLHVVWNQTIEASGRQRTDTVEFKRTH